MEKARKPGRRGNSGSETGSKKRQEDGEAAAFICQEELAVIFVLPDAGIGYYHYI